MINLQKHIWEGWTVGDFIEALEPIFDTIMSNGSDFNTNPFATKAEIVTWCKDNQPYYKKEIKEVSAYFIKKAGVK